MVTTNMAVSVINQTYVHPCSDNIIQTLLSFFAPEMYTGFTA